MSTPNGKFKLFVRGLREEAASLELATLFLIPKSPSLEVQSQLEEAEILIAKARNLLEKTENELN